VYNELLFEKVASIDLRYFSEFVRKLVSGDPDAAKQNYFRIIDLNKDKKLCERDIFDLLLMLEDE